MQLVVRTPVLGETLLAAEEGGAAQLDARWTAKPGLAGNLPTTLAHRHVG